MKNKSYKATAISPANIAFIKYWGKKDTVLNLPFNDSISMNMDNCLTTTTVEFDSKYKKDVVIMNGQKLADLKKVKVVRILDIVRKKVGLNLYAKVVTKNTFPADAGIAASASAFSALALASSSAAGIKMNFRDLSILARMGSGSAARSIPNGFAYWKAGLRSENSFAEQFKDERYWDLRDIVAVVDAGKKKVSSTEGHLEAQSSPFFITRLNELKRRVPQIKNAILKKDFKTFGALLEEEAVELHVIAMTSKPPIFYWEKGTFAIIAKLFELREKGIFAYFTMDAGANVHVMCRSRDERSVVSSLRKVPEVVNTIINKAGKGTRLLDKHLF